MRKYRQILVVRDGRGKADECRAYVFSENTPHGTGITAKRNEAAWDAFNDGERGEFSIYAFEFGKRVSRRWKNAGRITDEGVQWND